MSQSRLTRAAAREATALITQQFAKPPQPDATKRQAPSRKPRKILKKRTKRVIRKSPANAKRSQIKSTPKRELQKSALKADAAEELPHNLGPIPVSTSAVSSASSDKENQGHKQPLCPDLAEDGESTLKDVDKDTYQVKPESPTKGKNKRAYRLTPGCSPFPEWSHPTVKECEILNKLLSDVHGEVIPPKTIPAPSLTVTGCGEVPSVLDALIRTLLSAATTSTNSGRAFNGLVQRFGILDKGIGKGSVNWEAVRQASLKDVFDAIKSGGLADIKSKNLKAILDQVHEENQARRQLILSNQTDDLRPDNKARELKEPIKDDGINQQYEIACADQHFLSLNHLHAFSSEEAMTELTKYPGIGPKTAACVILFCLQRPCFAVDTHIFRLCKWLGWIPATGVNEVTAFSHLEVRIPNNLKYSLHQLLIRHGRSCPRCRAITGESSAGWEEGCAIDHLVTRTGVRKGASPVPAKRKKTARGKSPAKKRKVGTRDAAPTKKTKKAKPTSRGKKG